LPIVKGPFKHREWIGDRGAKGNGSWKIERDHKPENTEGVLNGAHERGGGKKVGN